MLIYHEVMATLNFLDYRKYKKHIQETINERLSQLKAEHKGLSIDMDKLQLVCSEQAKANDDFYKMAHEVKDKIVKNGNEMIALF